MDDEKIVAVRARAKQRCEYCRVPQQYFTETFQIEHIVARSHGGGDELDNLALACRHCNLHKGPNLSGIDPTSGQLTPLFDPRKDAWEEHFRIEGGAVRALTAVGRTTVYVLQMNAPRRVELRLALGELDGERWWRH